MESFRDAMRRLGVSDITVMKFLNDRTNRFRKMNDETWGKGNWVRCDICLDSLGYPAYHHKEFHE